MINRILFSITRWVLWLRYRIRVRGLEEIGRRGATGIVFLPNHPALIDPVILMSMLYERFSPLALADRNRIDRFFIRWVAGRIGVQPIPDLARHGPGGRDEVARGLGECIEQLRNGRNLLLYPAGRISRHGTEELGGNSAVETILRQAPQVRVVLVRTSGLWGSGFSWAGGREPNVAHLLRKGVVSLLASGVFFAPRREVTIEFREPDDLPREDDRTALNRYLEEFYNTGVQLNTYVPFTIWRRGAPRRPPAPALRQAAGHAEAVPQATRQILTEYLRELSGKRAIHETDLLARDLGLDSLARADLLVFLGREFGFAGGDVDSLLTVGDVMLGACGESFISHPAELMPVPQKWFSDLADDRSVSISDGGTVMEAFWAQASRTPDRPACADQSSGVKTYRDLILAIMLLKDEISDLPGRRLGIMLPAGVTADIVYLATLFADKTPVMVNWTVGARNILHTLEVADVRRVLTAQALLDKLRSQGVDLGQVEGRLVMLETFVGKIPLAKRLWAWLRSRFGRRGWACLEGVCDRAGKEVSEPAVILFTSGSESMPKVVPLSHTNLLTNLRDVLQVISIRRDERLAGILPPFHSFGLTVGVLLPLCCGMPVVHHANPNDAAGLVQIIKAYRPSLLIGTPTFLGGIVRAACGDELRSLRLAVTGAEKCPERVYSALVSRCPQAVVLEGYGVTECSPIISVSEEAAPRPFTIGKVLPSLEYVVVHAETLRQVQPGDMGVLLVRGPSVFEGYMSSEGARPFVAFEGEQWYRTGDLVSEDADGVLTFLGRLKRFVKIGGEMISLPAIESVLCRHYAPRETGPTIAVEATSSEARPELVLFTTAAAEGSMEQDEIRQEANRLIRAEGFSPLHNIRRVVHADEIPVMGAGKTDYKKLKELL
ncbi:MAG: AMP-binding protein [Planctomycetota bacterium]|nr:AMP-binding protein [Planctomycetota bacterium]